MYSNEDLMWQRLKDLQAEADNRRLMRSGSGLGAGSLVKMLAQRAWLLAGIAARRAPRRTWTDASSEGESRSRVA